MPRSQPITSLQRVRLALPLILAGAVIALVGVTMYRMNPREATASSVRMQIAAVVESRGYFGPFVLQAETYDAVTHEFLNFHAETDTLMVGARRAILSVDAKTDTVQFDLYDVTIVSVPERGDETTTVARDQYTLGPFDWKLDIVEDARQIDVIPN